MTALEVPTHIHTWQRVPGPDRHRYQCADPACRQLGHARISGRSWQAGTAESRHAELLKRMVPAFCRACKRPAVRRWLFQGALAQPLCQSCFDDVRAKEKV
jgi:hypothetical protein